MGAEPGGVVGGFLGYRRGTDDSVLRPPRDPWAPFRIWTALTIGLYALRAAFVTTVVGAIPGFVLLLMVLVSLLLAGAALLRPGRVRPWREGRR